MRIIYLPLKFNFKREIIQTLYIILIMNIESNSYENDSTKCKGCKLFFGSQAFKGFCSGCYKKQQGTQKEDIEKMKTQKIEVKVEEPVKKQQKVQAQSLQKDRNRCYNCSRKLKNLGIQCKCGLLFCSMHRLPEDHKCTFDHLNAGVKKLEKALIKVTNGKIDKIE